MPPSPPPPWFDSQGMRSWVQGMADALGRRVRLLYINEQTLVEAGRGEGQAQRIPLDVNGVHEAWLEITPEVGSGRSLESLKQAFETFRRMADMRNTIADLVKSNADQWREFNVLYRSSALLKGGNHEESIAQNLVAQSAAAIRKTSVAFFCSEDSPRIVADACQGEQSHIFEFKAWALAVDEARLESGGAELKRLGVDGAAPSDSLIVMPVGSDTSRYGSLLVVADDGRMLTSVDLKLVRLLAEQAGQAFANSDLIRKARAAERLQREMEVAAEIQESVLPPPEMENQWLDMVAVCRPAAWVGGDAYLMLPTDGDRLIAGVADVSGHGISSALLMNALASQMSAFVRNYQSPGMLLRLSNDLVARRVGAMGMFVTVVLASVAPDGRLCVASAGHPPLLVADSSGGVIELDKGGLPLGIVEGERYDEVETEIEPGAYVVAFSDGVTEARNADGEMYGIDRLRDALSAKVLGSPSSRVLVDDLLNDLVGFTGQEALDDDLTLMVLRRKDGR